MIHIVQKRERDNWGLYLHIPFCSQICHYCDFAKTALYDDSLINQYFGRLRRDLQNMLAYYTLTIPDFKISSVFLGGGTPGLFAIEYEELVKLWAPFLTPTAEVSLEANPDNVTAEALGIWRDLGWNRLSIGVQSFQAEGLKFLTREHDAKVTVLALERALRYFPNLNIDLIYGWEGQSDEKWRADLSQALSIGVPHLSLYTLTYEPRTPIGRRQLRGLIPEAGDDILYQRYHIARDLLSSHGFEHDEVSNWCRPEYSCHHNWLYWQDQGFIGLGAGATGYHPDSAGPGIRYRIHPDLRGYLRRESISKAENITPESQISSIVGHIGGQIEEERDKESWLFEYVGSSLRSSRGTDLQRIYRKTGWEWRPRPTVARGLDQGQLILKDGQYLILTPEEWFRETAWSVEVSMSFPNHSLML